MGYYIGLDMGTSSVGWAVTDTRYHILRKKGKDLWGVRLFDGAQTAAKRRSFRTSRRRREREKARIAYVKEIFAPAINEKDPGFLQRLEDSSFHIEDKKEHQPFALFADTGYTDRDYYEQYPTIFHLRKELIESDSPHDVRLVYLAVINMFRHRGHFLNPNLNDGEIGDLSQLLDYLKAALYEELELEFPLPEKMEDLEAILCDRSLTSSDRKDSVIRLLKIDKKNKPLVEIWKLICGLKGKLPEIFRDDVFSENDTKSVSFRDDNYETEETELEGVLSPESFDLFLAIKQVYDWSVLAAIMKSGGKTYQYLSMARVASYEKHGKDLRILKEVYRTYLPESYDDMFRVMKDNNYSAYVGSVNSREAGEMKTGDQKVRRGAKSKDFFKEVKKQIQGIDGYESIDSCQYILKEIDSGTFLPKQLTTDNGLIPNQVHRKELKKILENAESYLPFLKEKDPESGLTASERIMALFSFRIPYYVGPLKGTEDSNFWAVRKENGPVYPWNLSNKIDVKQTSQNFVENLIRRCTYLSDEKVLPKSSLLYEKFMVLNELNRLKIHGEPVSVELKQNIFRDLFRKTGKKVTNRSLLNYLKKEGVLEAEETLDAVAGYDKEEGGFTNRLANYHKFMEVFDVPVLTDEQVEISEGIIFYSTVYGESREFLKEKIQELYGDRLSASQMKRVLGFRFKDWGKLSREFLNLEGADCATGEVKSLIMRMWDENKNLGQLLDQDDYTYTSVLEGRREKIEKTLQEVTYEDLTDLYISAPVRRMVWQTIRIVQEIEKVMGEEPERIFIEMTRSEDKDKKRTDSRKKALLALYKGCAEEEKHLKSDIEGLDERKLRIKKLYLYYRQMGRCMYSGEPIQLDRLYDKGFYEIDHIYPRHYVKDDSLENNLVLVKAKCNQDKEDKYPIDAEIRQKCGGMWRSLRDRGFISEEKYKRLTRSQPFSEEDMIGFVNRQLVETGQGTKAVAEILTQVFSGGKANDRIVYVKAGNVSAFRDYYDLHKCRSVNDFHHANDAYLNIVVGNSYFTKFTRNARNFFRSGGQADNGDRSYNLYKLFDYRIRRGNVLAWDPQKDIETVRQMMARNTPVVSRRTFAAHGGISDQQILSAAKTKKAEGDGYIPIKASDERLADIMKYGGYGNVSGAYFFLVEHTQKKQRIRTIECIPVYLEEKYSGKAGLENYCLDELKLKDPSIRYEKIRMDSLMKVDGYYVYLTGRSGNDLLSCNAVQMCLKKIYSDYARLLDKAVENKIGEDEMQADIKRNAETSGKKRLVITREMNLELYDELLEKHSTGIYSRRKNPIGNQLTEGREKFVELPMDRQCYVLCQILSVSLRNNEGIDLHDLGFGKSVGKSRFNKNISRLNECKLIIQSISGLYRQEIDLLTV